MLTLTALTLVIISQCSSVEPDYFRNHIRCEGCKSEFKQNEPIKIDVINTGDKTICAAIVIKLFSDGRWKIVTDYIGKSYVLHIIKAKKKTPIIWENRQLFQKAGSSVNDDAWARHYNLAEGGRLAFYFYWGEPEKPRAEVLIHEFEIMPVNLKNDTSKEQNNKPCVPKTRSGGEIGE